MPFLFALKEPQSLSHHYSCIVLYLSFIYLTSQTSSYLKLRKGIIHLSILSAFLIAWYTMGTVECCNYTQVNIAVVQSSFLVSNINKFASRELYSVEKNGKSADHHCYFPYLLQSTLSNAEKELPH